MATRHAHDEPTVHCHPDIVRYRPVMEATYLGVLISTVLAIAAVSAYFLVRLFTGPR